MGSLRREHAQPYTFRSARLRLDNIPTDRILSAVNLEAAAVLAHLRKERRTAASCARRA